MKRALGPKGYSPHVTTSARPTPFNEMDRRARVHLAVISEPDGTDVAEYRAEKPKTRGDCADGPRPCPWVSCRHHLAIEVNEDNGSITLNQPGKQLWELEETCSLDVADDGPKTLDEVGQIFGVSRERIRQIEAKALRHGTARRFARANAELLDEEPETAWGSNRMRVLK